MGVDNTTADLCEIFPFLEVDDLAMLQAIDDVRGGPPTRSHTFRNIIPAMAIFDSPENKRDLAASSKVKGISSS
jgi:hypothetical protein